MVYILFWSEVRKLEINSKEKCGDGYDSEFQPINEVPCPTPPTCNWAMWGHWSEASQTCGSAVRTRIRSCKCGHLETSDQDCGDEKSLEMQKMKQKACSVSAKPYGDYTIPPTPYKTTYVAITHSSKLQT